MTNSRYFRGIFCLIVALLMHAAQPKEQAVAQTREWRGAWVSTVYQDYAKRNTAQNKKYLCSVLDSLLRCHCNAVIFQVRPKGDALYKSDIEPWSSWLTGTIGKAPDTDWDPLQFMVEESHKRGMEIHAWINPYRLDTSPLPSSHYAKQHPDRVVKFGTALILDPGIPENREYLISIIRDIVSRYDIDALHMDDYFYPYPNKKLKFNDKNSFAKYGNGASLGDWRRKNTAALIREAGAEIRRIKPWVRFGISPFGIWRNASSDPAGSNTRGTQCYDDLYADPVQWIREGWIDYLVPQIYWGMNKEIASARELNPWWGKQAHGRYVFIGQDVKVTMDSCELAEKMVLSRTTPGIAGNCWWPAYEVVRNYKEINSTLSEYWQSNYALPPTYPWISKGVPGEVENLRFSNGVLSWQPPKASSPLQEARFYVVYVFAPGATINLNDNTRIATITSECQYKLPHQLLNRRYRAVVTPLDRCNAQSLHPRVITLE
ncbi:MAG: family 10 glycosylhydrolase [Muribaculaceae bacterium]|nr:family 10 glycosylhydrolase [Muribaculaceae bacterium]